MPLRHGNLLVQALMMDIVIDNITDTS